MRHRRIGIHIMTILLLAAAFYFGIPGSVDAPALSFEILTGDGFEKIRMWEKETGEFYVFLPSYANLEDVQIRSDKTVVLDGRSFTDGMTCRGLELDTAYPLSGIKKPGTIMFVRSRDLPAVYIDTASGSMDYIHESKKNKESGTMRLYSADGSLRCRGTLKTISGRGNSTFLEEKKPYSLKLSAPADLLGMGEAEKWILLANYYDTSNLKNKLVLDYAARVGLAYTPESRWVDLWLNGEYAGLYLLCERNEVHPQRVALAENQGFLISKDNRQRMDDQSIPYFPTEKGVPLRIHYCSIPNERMMTLCQSAENAILAADGIDPQSGKHWEELIDLDSWARKYLVEEIFGGGDAGLYSQFFYYEGDGSQGKIYAGPVWDYDITMGTGGVEMTVPNVFFAHREYISPWFRALYDSGLFYSKITELFRREFYPQLVDLVEEEIPRYQALIEAAAGMNQIRWGGDTALQTERVQNYMRSRTEFLKKVWIDGQECVEVTVVHPDVLLEYAPMFAIPRGETFPELADWKQLDWCITGTDIPFDLTQPIREDVSIQARTPGQ